MKGKSRRKQTNVSYLNNGKAERLQQKSFNHESTHFNNPFQGTSIMGVLAIIGRFIKSFFNAKKSVIVIPQRINTYEPADDSILKSNPNKYKPWYKIHVPKSLRKGLTSIEILEVRKKLYRTRKVKQYV